MKQNTLAAAGFEVHRKATRKAAFLGRMDNRCHGLNSAR
jgi:hypothetical protein